MTKISGESPRLSPHIRRRVTQNIFRAFDYVKASGDGFNLYAVVNLRDTAHQSATTAFGRICHKYRDWLAHKSKKRGEKLHPRYTFSIESPNGHCHANWVLHIPADLVAEFRQKLPKWLEKVQGDAGPFDIDVQDIVPGTEKSLAKYVLKATEPDFIDHFHLRSYAEKHGNQGTVWGKRAGVSVSIGKAARDKDGFSPRRRRGFSSAAGIAW